MIVVQVKSLCGFIRSIWESRSLRGRFARGAVWSLLGAGVSQSSTLAASVIAARLLGQIQFGRYGMIQSTIGMLGIFAGLGLGVTSTKYVAELRAQNRDRAGRVIALSLALAGFLGGAMALGLLAFAPLLAARTLNDSHLSRDLRIGSALLFFNAFNGAQIGTLAGFEAFRSIAKINLVRGLLGLPVTVLGIYLWSVSGAIWALTVSAAFACLFAAVALRQQCATSAITIHFSGAWSERRVLWTFSTPAFFSGILVGPVVWVANSMLVNQNGGYAEMGLLSAANQWKNAIAFIPGIMAQFLLPLLSNLHGDRDTFRYEKVLRWNLLLTATAAILAAIPVMAAAHGILRIYGRSFQDGTWVLAISAAIAVISSVNAVVGTAITSSGSVWIGFAFNALWAAVFLLSSYCLIPRYFALGLVLSLLGAYIAHTGWQSLYISRHLVRLRKTSTCFSRLANSPYELLGQQF